MSELTQTPDPKDRVSSSLYFASLYFVTIGVLYLWGYWAPFGINILEYLALSDILKATAYPIATALLLTAIGAAIGEVLVNRSHFPSGGGRDTAIGRVLRKFAPILRILYVGGTVTLLLYGPVEKWRALPILLAFPIYAFAKQTEFLTQAIPHESPRSVVIYVLAVLPALAYGHGTLAANKIQTAKAFTYVASELPGYPVSTNAQTQPRLIGHAGDHLFFFDPMKTAVVVTKMESGKSLVLKQYEIPKEAAPAAGSNPSMKGSATTKPPSAP